MSVIDKPQRISSHLTNLLITLVANELKLQLYKVYKLHGATRQLILDVILHFTNN
jgi:hypothetical protein